MLWTSRIGGIGLKHLLSILLLICLHMPCATSEASREPILFRDIPWGVSITDAFKYLENDSLPLSTLSFVDRTATPFEQECFYEDHSTKDCFFQIYYGPYDVKKNPQLFVGGYIVCSMTLDAIAGINANGAISESADDSMLYHCTYNFGHWKDDEKEEAQAVFDDLARKLSVLYGEGLYETDRKELGNDSYWLIDFPGISFYKCLESAATLFGVHFFCRHDRPPSVCLELFQLSLDLLQIILELL